MGTGNTIRCIIATMIAVAVLTEGSYAQSLNVLLDSAKIKPLHASDSLNRYANKTDSLQAALSTHLDSATHRFNNSLSKLKNHNLSSAEYANKLDSSYNHFQEQTINKLKRTYDSLGLKTDARLSKMESTVKSKTHFLDSLLHANKIKGIDDQLNFGEKFNPNINLPTSTGVKVPSQGTPSVNTSNINLPTAQIPGNIGSQSNVLNAASLPEIDKIKDLQGELQEGIKATDNIKKNFY